MSDPLNSTLADMADARRELLALVAPLSAADMRRAQPGGWSIARVLQHVIESEHVYAKLLAHLCARAATDADTAEPAHGEDASAKLAATRAAVDSMVSGINDDTLYRLVKIGHEEYSPLSVLENIASHDRDHHGQIVGLLAPERPAERAPAAVSIRPATEADLAPIDEIYNHYIINTAITFDFVPYTAPERRAWFAKFAPTGPHRLFVAVDASGAIAGYAGAHQFRVKAAYDTTVETTIYCAPESAGRGIGAALYSALFDAIRGEDLLTAVAGITLPNDASVALHTRFGFTRSGVMHAVGRKFDEYWDVLWMEKRLRAG